MAASSWGSWISWLHTSRTALLRVSGDLSAGRGGGEGEVLKTRCLAAAAPPLLPRNLSCRHL